MRHRGCAETPRAAAAESAGRPRSARGPPPAAARARAARRSPTPFLERNGDSTLRRLAVDEVHALEDDAQALLLLSPQSVQSRGRRTSGLRPRATRRRPAPSALRDRRTPRCRSHGARCARPASARACPGARGARRASRAAASARGTATAPPAATPARGASAPSRRRPRRTAPASRRSAARRAAAPPAARRPRAPPFIACACSQASNWLRTASSLVPLPSVEPSAWRRSPSAPRRRSIQSSAASSSPRWQRSKSSRSSEATSEAGEAARLTNCSVRSCISAAAPSSRKHSTSTCVRFAAERHAPRASRRSARSPTRSARPGC